MISSSIRSSSVCRRTIYFAIAVVICLVYLLLSKQSPSYTGIARKVPKKCYWNVSENTHSPGGTAQNSSVSTVHDCQRSCSNDPACHAFDFNIRSPDGKYCWFSDTHQPVQYGKSPGVLHYNWVCKKHKSHKASSCTWNVSTNSNSANGIVQAHITSLQQCRSECMTIANCLGIDWDEKSVGSQCWFATTSNIFYQTARGVDHHQLVCPADKSIHVDKITDVTAVCKWEVQKNSHSPGGSLMSTQTDPEVCQMECLLTSGCYAIDWNVQHKECWFSTFPTVNSFPGVDHYQFSCQGGSSSSFSNGNILLLMFILTVHCWCFHRSCSLL